MLDRKADKTIQIKDSLQAKIEETTVLDKKTCEAIRELLEAKILTTREIAAHFGLSLQSISNVKKGSYKSKEERKKSASISR